MRLKYEILLSRVSRFLAINQLLLAIFGLKAEYINKSMVTNNYKSSFSNYLALSASILPIARSIAAIAG
jgi:hypothetical protein